MICPARRSVGICQAGNLPISGAKASLERLGRLGQVEEQKALPLGQPCAVQRVVGLVEADGLLHIARADSWPSRP